MSEVLIELIGLGGGLAGYVSIAYLLWKKYRKNVRIYGISGTYAVRNTKNEQLSDIISTIELGFLNDSDQTISITDIVGSLKYNKELYDKVVSSQINIPRIPQVYSERPQNFREVVNFNVAPHETVKKTTTIIFSDMFVDLIDRIGIAHFVGFIDGKIPFLSVYETELKEKWSVHPLDLLLTVHVDGKKIHNTNITLFRRSEGSESGTLNVIDIEKIKKEFQEGQH
jgi:hypothetical protein